MAVNEQYEILELVASGGTAVLHKGIQTSLDRVVAIKDLHPHLTSDKNFTWKFIIEAKAAASLNHDNIVKIIDFGTEKRACRIVMDFIEGDSLRDILDRWKRINVDAALAIIYQVCRGLEYAHAKGVLHRDIKPRNIMITRDGKVKITDFGLAKLMLPSTQHAATNANHSAPIYMSPEQVCCESVDERSDLFSLGAMFYEMLTGVQPFQDESYLGVIHKIMNKDVPPPSEFDVDVPREVQFLITKLMAKSRKSRLQSAENLRKAIEQYIGLGRLKRATQSLKHLINTGRRHPRGTTEGC